MFNSSVLDVAVGILFVFILVSTVCSAVREAIEHVMKQRAAYLEQGLRELFRDPKGRGLTTDFFDHPLISGLFRGSYEARSTERPRPWHRGKNLPSYIPSRQFALALMDVVTRGSMKQPVPDANVVKVTYASLRASVEKMQNNTHVQRALLMALDASQDDLERARLNIQAWYDGTMDRVSGWYKRSTQLIIFAIALAVTVVLNVDTVAIARTLYRDPAVLQLVVAQAEKAHEQLRSKEAFDTLGAMDLPLGWEFMKAEGSRTQDPAPWPAFKMHWLGWLLTAFAATLGAPFWFDVLNKVMVIRSTVKPHEKSPEEGSEDRQPRKEPPANDNATARTAA
jgi:hypothetical protein